MSIKEIYLLSDSTLQMLNEAATLSVEELKKHIANGRLQNESYMQMMSLGVTTQVVMQEREKRKQQSIPCDSQVLRDSYVTLT